MFELIPANSFRNLGSLRREMDGLWDTLMGPGSLPFSGVKESFSPLVNLADKGDCLEVTAELPGLKPEELDISLNGDVLTIKGEKKEELEEDHKGYHLIERRYGEFSRSFRLPDEVDRESLKATHKNGIVKIVLPKKAKESSTAIEIEVE
ncbi:Hsp20/alpha crystallin family protein [Dethiosulfatarculus sandiegensis]|uniref:Molecular chaperone n=1 Tax=Dethiosulfatarculus sandiegensis TaxID=1429043 RepID=A0A0D2IZ93_9BACT|nr:Hsp20/alpha crystallin family protein [Dethiosulfatarculus sandiegensis]KIX11354.1 molecular chaperone [Dethiosulfatarculus sandiegensis]